MAVEDIRAGAAGLVLMMGSSAGADKILTGTTDATLAGLDSTGLGLATAARVDTFDEGATSFGAGADDAGDDGAFAELYPMTEPPDLATSSAGQETTSQSTL